MVTLAANVDGLCTKLTLPCPKSRPVVQFRELEVTRDAVKLFNRLGAGCFGEVWKGLTTSIVCCTLAAYMFVSFWIIKFVSNLHI